MCHEPVFTVQETQTIKNKINGIGCKNLFLVHKNHYYLVILEDNKKADLKYIDQIVKITYVIFYFSIYNKVKFLKKTCVYIFKCVIIMIE